MRVTLARTPDDAPHPAQGLAVVIDVLRATTTLTAALAAGVAGVVPIERVEDAFAARDARPGALLGGERGSRPLAGFDLGNSPSEYTPDRVAGRIVVFTSTNGARALAAVAHLDRVLGAFVNASAVVAMAVRARGVHLVCAGRHGAFALEDAACAGWFAARLAERGAVLDAGARWAAAIAPRSAGEVRSVVQGSAHGRELRAMGESFALDVETCGSLDTVDRAFVLPREGRR